MRAGFIFLVLTLSSGCTSMLLGSASTGDGSAPAERRSSAQLAQDNSISTSIRRDLSADDLVGRYAIGISTTANVVTLSGTVGSFAARDRAVQIAADTPRVASVRNRIVVNTAQ